MRKIITGVITAGGLFLFLLVFGIICTFKKLKKMQRFSRTRVNIEPAKIGGGKHDQSDLTILKND